MKIVVYFCMTFLILVLAGALLSEVVHINRNCTKIYDGESTTIRGVQYPHYVWACPDGKP